MDVLRYRFILKSEESRRSMRVRLYFIRERLVMDVLISLADLRQESCVFVGRMRLSLGASRKLGAARAPFYVQCFPAKARIANNAHDLCEGGLPSAAENPMSLPVPIAVISASSHIAARRGGRRFHGGPCALSRQSAQHGRWLAERSSSASSPSANHHAETLLTALPLVVRGGNGPRQYIVVEDDPKRHKAEELGEAAASDQIW